MSLIVPSLLAADPLNLQQDIDMLVALGLRHIHIDIMDYHFTHNFGFTPATCKAILSQYPNLELDAHFMTQPTSLQLIDAFLDAGIKKILIVELHNQE